MATTSTTYKHDDYWKVQCRGLTSNDMRAELAKRGYKINSNAQKSDLEEAMRRSALGHMSYHDISNGELRQFIRARRIDASRVIVGRRTGTRGDLTDLLKADDDRPRFKDFMRLPSEMRNLVYEYYYDEFQQPIYAPTQPPITLTCWAIRKETLEMFYNRSTFAIVLVNRPTRDIRLRLEFPVQLAMWLHTLPDKCLANITRLGLYARLDDDQLPKKSENELFQLREFHCQIMLDLVLNDTFSQCSIVVSPYCDQRPGQAEMIRTSVLRSARRIASDEEGRIKLTKNDVFDLRRAIEARLIS